MGRIMDAAFRLLAPTATETPLIVEIPHAGLGVPPYFLPELVAPARALGRDADLYVDDLYADAPARGATVLAATTSRYIVDLNRAETDVDGQSVEGGPPGHAPRGVIWRITTEGDHAIARPLRRAVVEARLRDVYRPYHQTLRNLIEAKRERFGIAVVLAAHSMPSAGRAVHLDRDHVRADVVPGTRGRTSADGRLIDLVDRHARDAGWSVVHDEPYRGGFTTEHYGRPAERVHVVQVELARRLYMDETSLAKRPEPFDRVKAWCGELVAKLGRAALTLSS